MSAIHAPNGFTLLELLVALAVLSFVLIGLAQGTHFGLLTWTTEARMSSGNDDLNIVDSTVRRLIEGMDPGYDLNPAPMAGSGDQIDFVTTLSNASNSMSVRRMRAELLVDGDHRLVLRWRPYLHAMHPGPLPAHSDIELLRGVSRIAVSYWRSGSGWVSVWRNSELPALVRVRLQFPAGDSRHWPEIVAAPRLDRP